MAFLDSIKDFCSWLFATLAMHVRLFAVAPRRVIRTAWPPIRKQQHVRFPGAAGKEPQILKCPALPSVTV